MEMFKATTNGLPIVPFSDVVAQREAFMRGETRDYIAQEGGQVNTLRTDADIVISGGNRGGGKANSYYADVITPDGVKKMGDLKVGDKISTPYEGTQTVEAIFEQGTQTVYNFYFDDGSMSTVMPNHRFMARFGHDKAFEVMTAEQIMKRYRIGMEYPNSLKRADSNGRLYLPKVLAEIPMCAAVPMREDVTPDKLPMHPYILGIITSRGQLAMTNNGASIAHYNPTAKSRAFELGYVWRYYLSLIHI